MGFLATTMQAIVQQRRGALQSTQFRHHLETALGSKTAPLPSAAIASVVSPGPPPRAGRQRLAPGVPRGLHECAGAALTAPGTRLCTRSLVCYRRTQLARCTGHANGKEGARFPSPPEARLPQSSTCSPAWKLLNPSLLHFYGDSSVGAWVMASPWPWVMSPPRAPHSHTQETESSHSLIKRPVLATSPQSYVWV